MTQERAQGEGLLHARTHARPRRTITHALSHSLTLTGRRQEAVRAGVHVLSRDGMMTVMCVSPPPGGLCMYATHRDRPKERDKERTKNGNTPPLRGPACLAVRI